MNDPLDLGCLTVTKASEDETWKLDDKDRTCYEFEGHLDEWIRANFSARSGKKLTRRRRTQCIHITRGFIIGKDWSLAWRRRFYINRWRCHLRRLSNIWV